MTRLPLAPLLGDCPPRRSECQRIQCRYFLGPAAPHPCVLVLASDEGGMTLDAIGEVLGGISRERVRQCEASGLKKLREAGYDLEAMRSRPETHAEHLENNAPGGFGTTRGWKGRR